MIMGKRGPKPNASDSEIARLLLQGQTMQEVADALGVSLSKVKLVKRSHIKPDNNLPAVDKLKAVVRLEITQEKTLSDLASQLKEYTDRYNAAKTANDEKAAYAWSQNRIKIIDMMAKITGLYDKKPEQAGQEKTVVVFEEIE